MNELFLGTGSRLSVKIPEALVAKLRILRSQLAILRRHQLFLPLLSGLLIRLSIAPWTEQRWDSYINRLMGAYVFGYGIDPLFPERSCNCPPALNYSYPPLWLMLIIPLFFVWLTVTRFGFPASPASLWANWTSTGNMFEAYRSFIPSNLPLLDFLFKTPIITADIGVGYLIWVMGGRTKRAARISLLAWILNPYAIMVGSWWGEFDSIAVLFMLLSIYYLEKNSLALSGFWLGMGISTKLFPGILVIPVAYYLLLKKGQLLRYSASLFSTVGVTFSSFLLFPFAFDYVIRLFTGRVSPDLAGSNVFSGLSWLVLLNPLLSSLPRMPFLVLILPLIMIFLISRFRGSLTQPGVILAFLTSNFVGIYLSYPTINPQYPSWTIPMLAVLQMRKALSKWAIVGFSALPLTFLMVIFNPLYLLSPALVFDENNYPPGSDVIQQLWNFPSLLYPVFPILFTMIVVITMRQLLKSRNSVDSSLIGPRIGKNR